MSTTMSCGQAGRAGTLHLSERHKVSWAEEHSYIWKSSNSSFVSFHPKILTQVIVKLSASIITNNRPLRICVFILNLLGATQTLTATTCHGGHTPARTDLTLMVIAAPLKSGDIVHIDTSITTADLANTIVDLVFPAILIWWTVWTSGSKVRTNTIPIGPE